MGFMEQAAAKLARKYGTVSDGKHQGCQVALGNDPSKKVEATYSFSQIIFLQGTEEKGRYELIGDDIKAMAITGVENDGLQIKLLFADGEDCDFLLETGAKKDKDMSKITYLIKVWLGQKKVNLPPDQQRKENLKDIKIFMQSAMLLLVEPSLDLLEEFYKTNDVMEDLDKKLFEITRKKFKK